MEHHIYVTGVVSKYHHNTEIYLCNIYRSAESWNFIRGKEDNTYYVGSSDEENVH